MLVVSSLGLVSYGAHDDEDDSDAEGKNSGVEDENEETANPDSADLSTQVFALS